MDNEIKLATRWLSDTDSRNREPEARSFGGTNNGYDYRKKQYPFVYSEITGYSVSCFLNIFRWTGDQKYLSLARQTGDFLLSLQCQDKLREEHGAVAHGLSIPESTIFPHYYSFDCAMIAQGLMALYEEISQEEHLQASVRLGDWLVKKMQKPDGSFLSRSGIFPVRHLSGMMYTWCTQFSLAAMYWWENHVHGGQAVETMIEELF